ncbi:thioredoxin domain-containing protein [Methanobrevibacter arboriphilus]|uniref:thioredoxin domain-containing protein n=1 Tax=Methanobrevibacter arboriphilus TaxID=39441 RepID=UPI000B02350D|nr:thioredoxin domain-containing protein [Methanobrevibacter arboriphilus]
MNINKKSINKNNKNNNSNNKINENRKPNDLINETSPYLLQHAYNPVNWHPWNEKSFSLAKKRK